MLKTLPSGLQMAGAVYANGEPADVRDPDCRFYGETPAGVVVAIETQVVVHPETTYALYKVELVSELEQGVGGPTSLKCVVLDENKVPSASVTVLLAWPWPKIEKTQGPGNPNMVHELSGGVYYPPNIGPLAFYVAGPDGRIDSDECGGWGLPKGHHLGGQITWIKRGAIVVPGGGEYRAQLDRLEAKVDRIGGHFA